MVSRRSPLIGLVAISLVLASACGGDDSSSDAAGTAAAASTVAARAAPAAQPMTIIDVRTPEEYAEGHLAGAVNYNVEDGTLEAALADLDPSASYAVYCRSGRRSAVAAELMAGRGFTEVDDLGALDAAAAATGLQVVAG